MFKRHSLIIIGVLVAIILTMSFAILRVTEVRTDSLKDFYSEHLDQAFELYSADCVNQLKNMYDNLSEDAIFVSSFTDQTIHPLDLENRSVDYLLVSNEDLTLLDEGGGQLMGDMMLTDVFGDALEKNMYTYCVTKIDKDYYYIAAGPMCLSESDELSGVLLLADKIERDDFKKNFSLASSIIDGEVSIDTSPLLDTSQSNKLNVSHRLLDSPYYFNAKFDLVPYNVSIKNQALKIIYTVVVYAVIGGIVILMALHGYYLKIEKIDRHLKTYVEDDFKSTLQLSSDNGYSTLNSLSESINKINYRMRSNIDSIDEDDDVILGFITDVCSANLNYTYQHQNAVPGYVEILCKALKLDEYEDIVKAAHIHDIGLMAVPRHILDKPGELNPLERDLVKQHAAKGQACVAAIRKFRKAAIFVGAHHENWDGSGYPNGLVGDAIPLGAQIIGLADLYDALTSDRPYRPANTHEQASIFILENTGKRFSPRLVEAYRLSSDAFNAHRQSLLK